ncbi:MAG: hypothetical protein BGO39_33190 [Chloroflexi bacterium 54-19]|nr:MAG: hypothetical protein BGO39_33190 [Chloroflexi bacterium 54-19]
MGVFKNKELENFYGELISTNSVKSSFQINHIFLTAFRLVKNVLEASGKKRLVLVLDEFDQIIFKFPGAVFRHLRAIKDLFLESLVFVVGTNRPLVACGRENEEDVAEFYELFEIPNLVRLKGFTRDESDKLVAPTVEPTDFEKQNWIYELAGGHPGLTLRMVQLLKAEVKPYHSFDEFLAAARQDPQLRLECRRIWNSLVTDEQVALLQWLEGIRNLTTDPILGSLEERGLLKLKPGSQRGPGSRVEEIFARVFEWFLREKLEFEKAVTVSLPNPNPNPNPNSFTGSGPASTSTSASTFTSKNGNEFKGQETFSENPFLNFRLAFDPVHEVLYFEEGKNKLPLTGNAAILFKYLFLRQSIPYCSKDELISAVWGQEAAYSSENLDRLVSDLRQIIGDQDKQIIRTIHRRGLQMVGVGEWRPGKGPETVA